MHCRLVLLPCFVAFLVALPCRLALSPCPVALFCRFVALPGCLAFSGFLSPCCLCPLHYCLALLLCVVVLACCVALPPCLAALACCFPLPCLVASPCCLALLLCFLPCLAILSAHDLCAGPYLRPSTRIWTRTRIPCCIALLPCLATLCSCLAFLPCLSALPACLALACRRYFARLSAFAALLAVVPCPALRFALPCLALPYAMDVKPTSVNMATLAYRVDNVDLNPKINKLGGPGRDVAFACTRPGCRARRPHPLG